MPELPEVETIARQLNQVLRGKALERVEVLRDKSFEGDARRMVGWKVKDVRRKAKVLEIYFVGQVEMIIVHLKMTGQLVYVDGDKRFVGGHPTADWVNELPSKHTRVVWYFRNRGRLFFNDMRVFGWMKLVSIEAYKRMTKKKAPDVVDPEFTSEYLFNILKNSRKSVKLVLLDQNKMGGVGNIYANDALFLAGVRPDRKGNELTFAETNDLCKAVKSVISDGIKYGGASAADEKYVDITGVGGKYQDHFKVYQRDRSGCLVCGGRIVKTRIGGRGTFYCPNCQK